jgi:PQQ-like domain
MKTFLALAFISLGGADMAHAQGRSLDWPFFGGDAQRTGWEKSDSRITKENVKDFQLVLKRKLDNQQTGPRSLTAPVVIGNLISYKGFKELALVSGSSGNVWAIDADLNRMFWEKHFDSASTQSTANRSGSCSGGLTAAPALTPGFTFGGARPRPGARPAAPAAAPGAPAATANKPPTTVSFGAARPLFVVSSDGKLHRLNTSNGSDQLPPLDFLPANAKASSLVLHENVVYTTTNSGCGGAPNAVWAIDVSGAAPKINSFPLNGGGVWGLGGLALGTDGTVYVQTGDGPLDPASNKWSNTVLALTPKDLKLKQYFTDPDSASSSKSAPEMNVTTPVVFAYKGRDLIVSAGKDGRLHVLDSQALGGDDHKTPISQTPSLSSSAESPNYGIWGGLSSWEDTDGTRWVIAPVWGPVNSELKLPLTNGAAPNGAYVAFRLEEQEGKPLLAPAWISRDMSSPAPAVIGSGLVFALSEGSTHATLYVLDATTGKELYSTGNQVSAPGNLTGLTIANGRVYFTTTDNTLYAFGIPLEIY